MSGRTPTRRLRTGLVVRILVALALPIGVAGCGGDKGEETAGPADQGAAPAPATRDGEQVAAPASAPPDPFLEKLDAAAGCVRDGRLDRRCAGYTELSQSLAQKADPAAIDKLLAAVETGDAAHKTVALALLARPYPNEGDVAKRLLPRVDAESDPMLKADLLRALAPRAAEGVAEKALALLREAKEPVVRAAAARVLGHEAHAAFGEQAAPALLEALQKDTAPAVRRQAATALGNLKHAAAVPHLITALDDPLVAPSATFALARFETPEAYEAIWSRIEAGAKTGEVSLALLAAVKLLEDHPRHDAKKAVRVLERLRKKLQKTAGDDQSSAAALRLVERNLERMKKGGKPPAKGAGR